MQKIPHLKEKHIRQLAACYRDYDVETVESFELVQKLGVLWYAEYMNGLRSKFLGDVN